MAIELPRGQQAGGLPGLPPVNRHMTSKCASEREGGREGGREGVCVLLWCKAHTLAVAVFSTHTLSLPTLPPLLSLSRASAAEGVGVCGFERVPAWSFLVAFLFVASPLHLIYASLPRSLPPNPAHHQRIWKRLID